MCACIFFKAKLYGSSTNLGEWFFVVLKNHSLLFEGYSRIAAINLLFLNTCT